MASYVLWSSHLLVVKSDLKKLEQNFDLPENLQVILGLTPHVFHREFGEWLSVSRFFSVKNVFKALILNWKDFVQLIVWKESWLQHFKVKTHIFKYFWNPFFIMHLGLVSSSEHQSLKSQPHSAYLWVFYQINPRDFFKHLSDRVFWEFATLLPSRAHNLLVRSREHFDAFNERFQNEFDRCLILSRVLSEVWLDEFLKFTNEILADIFEQQKRWLVQLLVVGVWHRCQKGVPSVYRNDCDVW